MAPIWVSDKPMLCILMVPLSRAKRTFSADICLKTARFGALGTPPSWQTAQRCLNSVSPSLFVGVTSCLAAARQEGARENKRKANPVRKRRMFEEYLMSNYLPGETKMYFGKHHVCMASIGISLRVSARKGFCSTSASSRATNACDLATVMMYPL